MDEARSSGGLAVTAQHPQFLLYAGDSWQFDAALHDNVGDPLPLAGAIIIWRLRNAAQAVVASLSIGDGIEITGAEAGTCRIMVAPEKTVLLPPGNYRDETWATTASGFVTTQAVGSIVVAKAGAPASTTDLRAELLALKKARRSGVRSVTVEGFSTTYATDDEMAAAIAATEREIAGSSQPRNLIVRATKGW